MMVSRINTDQMIALTVMVYRNEVSNTDFFFAMFTEAERPAIPNAITNEMNNPIEAMP